MKAAVYYETGSPDVLRYEDRPDPPCQPAGVVIDVKAISIEGGDVLNRAGGEMPSRPHVVGYQCAGVIREVGPSVQDRSVGEAVVAVMPFGSHASLVSLAAMQTFPIPDGLEMKTAACVPIAFGTAHECLLEIGGIKPGETVLIQAGAGGVGLAGIQLAKRAGATVLATASSDDKLARLKEFGLDHGINYKTDDLVKRALDLTGGRGVDLVLESVGTTLRASVDCTAYRGRIVQVGNAGRETDTRVDVSSLAAKNRSLTGVSFANSLMLEPLRTRPVVESLLQDVAAGALRVVVDRTYSLSEAAEAHGYIESRQAFGRVVMIP